MLTRGLSYFRENRVSLVSIDDFEAIYTVTGSMPYTVTVRDTNNTLRGLVFTCTCPHAAGVPKVICKHKVSAAYALQNYARTHKSTSWKTVLSTALEQSAPTRRRSSRTVLVFSLQSWGADWRVVPYTLPTTGIPPAFLTDKTQFLQYMTSTRALGHANHYNAYSQTQQSYLFATPAHLQVARICALLNMYSVRSLDHVLMQLTDAMVFQGEMYNPLKTPLTIVPTTAAVTLSLEPAAKGTQIIPTLQLDEQTIILKPGKTQVISTDPLWVLTEEKVVRAEGDAQLLRSLLSQDAIIIPEEDEQTFIERYLAPLAERLPVQGGVVANREELNATPRPRVYLNEEAGSIAADLAFVYDDYELPYDGALPAQSIRHDAERSTLICIHRQPDLEADTWTKLNTFGLKRDGDRHILRQTTSPVDFLMRQVPRLHQQGFEVFGEEALTSARVNRNRPTLSLRVSSEIDWFDVQAVVNFGELEVSLSEFRRAIRKREGYVKLPDGSLGAIPTEWLERYRYLFDMGEENEQGGMRYGKAQATLLNLALAEADDAQADEAYTQRYLRLRDLSGITPVAPPQGLHGQLRDYQRSGHDWLHFLHEYEFGGCLADDMGIGKTIQALAFMLSLKESGHTKAASLVVVPRSLLVNWQREAERFTPDLRVLLHADGDRLQDDPTVFDQYDLVVTTYGVMLRDLELLRKYRFHYVILDEAQTIKNPLAQTSRAARTLIADHRLALTGTPVENSTEELWSLFAFLNQGMLGSLDMFRKTFTLPIQRQQDETAAKHLRALVYPFILRRTKEQVAPELPPRTERIVYCEMEPAQRKVYTRWRDQYRAQLLGLIDDGGVQNARMKILEGLLRLRQLCNHPRLLEPTFKGTSAKFEALLETLDTLRAEGHKALIFSQFTQMLKLVKEALDARDIPYQYLDGQTKDRQERVDQFQQDPTIPFFLISLRAGGTGLNLTAADYVIHIDPWWNPAVERQATDRTHRIGQENPVMVYKLIAKDSVEEKILQLQERKQALVDQLISTDRGFMKALTRDDVVALFG